VNLSPYVTVLQNFYLIDAHLCGLLVIINSRRLLYFIYKEVRIGFLPRDTMLAWYMLSLYVFVSVCMCVSVTCRHYVKTANVGSCKQCYMTVQELVVDQCLKSGGNSNGLTPHGGAKGRWGRLISATFNN